MGVALIATNCARLQTGGPVPKRDIGTGVESNQFPAGPAPNTPIGFLLTHKPFASLCWMRTTVFVRFKCGSPRTQRTCTQAGTALLADSTT